jgi:diamine N-acetyltransferase
MVERFVVVQSAGEIGQCASLLATSFMTVATEFGLTIENAPSNPAFMTPATLSEYLAKGILLYALLVNEQMVGCVAVESSKSTAGSFYIERLAVAPKYRHHSYGGKLLAFALDVIGRMGGKTASLGIMNQNTVLKSWYLQKGFVDKELRSFPYLPFEVCFMTKSITTEN